MADLVLVTEPEYRKAEDVFRTAWGAVFEPAPATESELARHALQRGARVVIVGVMPYVGPLYEAIGSMRGMIVRFGVGHDNIDKAMARRYGVTIANTPGVLDGSVAEHAIWLMGCLARKISRLEGVFRMGGFAGETGIELAGRTLGILGFGRIGRRVAAMAHFGFGIRVIAGDSRAVAEIEATEGQSIEDVLANAGTEEYTTDIETVFRAADVLSIHLPVTQGTMRFINRERLSWMKSSALLINTARGALLDEGALYEALAGGALAGAALDVFESEPYEPVDPSKDLRNLPNIVLTPHVGSNTVEANERMGKASIDNALKFLAGQVGQISIVT